MPQSNPPDMASAPHTESAPPPAGYSLLIGPDNRQYLVPTFLVPSTQLAFDAQKARDDLNTDAARGGVCNISYYSQTITNLIKPL
jgi:hypothetical protein